MLDGGYREGQVKVGGALKMESWRVKSSDVDRQTYSPPIQKMLTVEMSTISATVISTDVLCFRTNRNKYVSSHFNDRTSKGSSLCSRNFALGSK